MPKWLGGKLNIRLNTQGRHSKRHPQLIESMLLSLLHRLPCLPQRSNMCFDILPVSLPAFGIVTTWDHPGTKQYLVNILSRLHIFE